MIFTKLTNRFDSYSMKWDVAPQVLPMWVADMDFETAPEIVEALHNRVNHKIFGYNIVPDEFLKYSTLVEEKTSFSNGKEWMMFVQGLFQLFHQL